jgi:arylformamidase
MIIHDISRLIAPDVAGYPGDDNIAFGEVCTIAETGPCNVTSLENWTTHFLTHVDPPRHFVAAGATLEDVAIDRWMQPAIVVEVSGDAVTSADIPACDGKAVLFKTRNSDAPKDRFATDHVYVSKEAAESLVAEGATLAGVDYLSIDRYGDEDYPAHRTLLGNDVLILEGLDLSGINPGEYFLVALPLRIANGDGSPVRAVLIEEVNGAYIR